MQRMKFTPAQAQVLADVSVETLRYWKRYLAPIAEKRGHAPCYSRGEVLALIVIRRLVRDFRIDVSVLAGSAIQLFAACAPQWHPSAGRWLLVSLGGDVLVRDVLMPDELAEPVIVFPMAAALRELDERLGEQDADSQLPLNLGPVAVGRAGGMR